MKFVLALIIGILLIQAGISGSVGSLLAAIIAPEFMESDYGGAASGEFGGAV